MCEGVKVIYIFFNSLTRACACVYIMQFKNVLF